MPETQIFFLTSVLWWSPAVPFTLKLPQSHCGTTSSPESPCVWSAVIKQDKIKAQTRKSWFRFDCASAVKFNNSFRTCVERVVTVTNAVSSSCFSQRSGFLKHNQKDPGHREWDWLWRESEHGVRLWEERASLGWGGCHPNPRYYK